MLTENQNNRLGQKLQDLDQIPDGFDFSSDAVWHQLETKLTQEKKPAPFFIYKKNLVAASLILAISLIAFLLVRTQIKPDPSNLVLKQNQVIKSNQPSTKTVHIFAAIPKKRIQILNPSEKKQRVQYIETSAPIKSEIAIIEPTISNAPVSANSVVVSTAVVEKKQPPVAKRLPILHINELGKVPEPVYSKNNINNYLNEVEEAPASNEHQKSWWLPKPKPVNPIISLTDNQ